MTTDSQISLAKQIASQIQSAISCQCLADDWDDNGGFSLICYLPFRKHRPIDSNFSMRMITNSIRRVMRNYKGLATLNWLETPEREYDRSFGECYFTRYSRNYIKIDVNVY